MKYPKLIVANPLKNFFLLGSRKMAKQLGRIETRVEIKLISPLC